MTEILRAELVLPPFTSRILRQNRRRTLLSCQGGGKIEFMAKPIHIRLFSANSRGLFPGFLAFPAIRLDRYVVNTSKFEI